MCSASTTIVLHAGASSASATAAFVASGGVKSTLKSSACSVAASRAEA
jgi:hypothetical protein